MMQKHSLSKPEEQLCKRYLKQTFNITEKRHVFQLTKTLKGIGKPVGEGPVSTRKLYASTRADTVNAKRRLCTITHLRPHNMRALHTSYPFFSKLHASSLEVTRPICIRDPGEMKAWFKCHKDNSKDLDGVYFIL